MASFDWVEAVKFARKRYTNGDWSLEHLAANLENIPDDADATGHREAQILRRTWGELEIANALDLDGELPATPAEVDELLLAFANEVERAVNG